MKVYILINKYYLESYKGGFGYVEEFETISKARKYMQRNGMTENTYQIIKVEKKK